MPFCEEMMDVGIDEFDVNGIDEDLEVVSRCELVIDIDVMRVG